MSSEERFYSFVLWVQLDMAKSKKSKEKSMVGDGVIRWEQQKRSIPRDSADTYSAVEGRSPPAKFRNTVSPTPPATAPLDNAQTKRTIATKQATIALVAATPISTVPTSQ
jgi:hypothetical protein